MISFIVGLFIGGTVGFFIGAVINNIPRDEEARLGEIQMFADEEIRNARVSDPEIKTVRWWSK